MNAEVKRKRSSSALPSIQRVGVKDDRQRSRLNSFSSDIVPQIVPLGNGSQELSTSRPALANLPSLSNVGFQSIFQNSSLRRSQQSVNSEDLNDRLQTISPVSSSRSNTITSYNSHKTDSNVSADSSRKRSSSKSTRPTLKTTNDKSERSSRLFKSLSNKSSTSLSSSLLNSTAHSSKSSFSKAARKLFRKKDHSLESENEAARAPANVPTSAFGKFLHHQYNKHVGKVSSHYMHSAGNLMDSGKSVYSFNPAFTNNSNDVPLQLVQEANFDATDVHMLHDLVKNLKSLDSNYKSFTMEEQEALISNIWGVFCNIILSLFKNQKLWELPTKVEDINHVLEFYIKLKTESRASTNSSKFISEIEEFLTTSLYILENQIVFNYNNENTINTALKRLCVIWEVFYQQIYHGVMAVLLPLETSFQNNHHYWSEMHSSFINDSSGNVRTSTLSVDFLLLKSFRDSIVLPYYQSFINSNAGASKGFHMYIMNEEEEKGVTQQDKLVLLQCFGILSSIQSNDINQTLIDDLLVGIRMSI